MKMLFAALTLTFSTAAFAESAHSYFLTCGTKNQSVAMTLVASEVYGVVVSNVVYTEAGRETQVPTFTTDVEMDGKNVPKRFSFYHDYKHVELNLPADAMTSAAYASAGMGAKAVITIDGTIYEAPCTTPDAR